MFSTLVLLVGSSVAAASDLDDFDVDDAVAAGSQVTVVQHDDTATNHSTLHRASGSSHHRSNGSNGTRRQQQQGRIASVLLDRRRGAQSDSSSSRVRLAARRQTGERASAVHQASTYVQDDAEIVEGLPIGAAPHGVGLNGIGLGSMEMPYGPMGGYGVEECDHGPEFGATPHCCPMRSTCNMPQHMQYYPAAHGYYYFRPYNYFHIYWQQAFVETYGGDPRDPYTNRIFQQVYALYPESELDGPIKLRTRGLEHELRRRGGYEQRLIEPPGFEVEEEIFDDVPEPPSTGRRPRPLSRDAVDNGVPREGHTTVSALKGHFGDRSSEERPASFRIVSTSDAPASVASGTSGSQEDSSHGCCGRDTATTKSSRRTARPAVAHSTAEGEVDGTATRHAIANGEPKQDNRQIRFLTPVDSDRSR